MAYDLWYFPHSYEFGESVGGLVAPFPADTVFYRAVYVGEYGELDVNLGPARQRLSTHDFYSLKEIYVLRPTVSTDGVPFRAALIYCVAQYTEAERFGDPRLPVTHRVSVYRAMATRYQAIRAGSALPWEQGYIQGRSCYFLIGVGSAGDLWRLSRLEADALGRQVLTLAPVRSAHLIAVPNFDLVPSPRLRAYLAEYFEAFQRAVASAAHLEIVDRAANITEGVLDYCLTEAGQEVPRTLAERLEVAKKVLEDKQARTKFPLTTHAYHLAHKIRELHARSHADQAVGRGRTVRPEVGMGLASDLSELLVEVGLARY